MDSCMKPWLLFDTKVPVAEEFEVDGLRLLLKSLDSYEEYLETRRLVEDVSRCTTWHPREYVEGMLRLTSYYPFVVVVLDEASGSASPLSSNSTAQTSAASDPADASSDASTISASQRGKVVGYMEVYTLPHVGRSCDSRLERVVVDPQYRNRGICQAMVKFVVAFCKDILCCNRIDMTCTNPVAMRIYAKFGFEPLETNVYRKTLC